MEIELLIRKKKEIYSSIMELIDDTENTDMKCLIKIFEKHEILKDKEEIFSIFRLLNKISCDHHRFPDLFNKILKIIQYLIQGKIPHISDFDIYKRFKYNKHILLLLLEQKIIQLNEEIISYIKKSIDSKGYIYYLYPVIKSFLDADEIEKIESEIKEKYGYEISQFVEKFRIGENDSYICTLIRQDSAEEFISYVNRTKTSLLSQIQPSIFETNVYLQRKTTLIEYAAFFGSIQIIQYLRYSNVSLTSSLWNYGIYSNNAELIHFLEENVNKQDTNYDEIFVKSIMCHHNSIADYIKDNYLDPTKTDHHAYDISLFDNYYYFPTDIEYLISRSNENGGFKISHLCFNLTQITIPSSVTSIGNHAFFECSLIEKIIIPSSVTSIGNFAFCECSSLAQITIPSSVTSIGNFAFCNCSSLVQITIPSSVTSINDFTFSCCSSLKQIVIPASVTSIGNYSFCKCSVLEQISIPSSSTSIGKGAFYGCSSLTEILIPNSVTSIGNGAFCGCSSLTEIEIPSSVNIINKLISENVDKDFYLEEIKFTDELRSIKYINDSTIYISDLPVNEEVYPPSCNVDEEFLRELFEDYHISSSSDAITINTTIRKDGTAYSFAYIEFDTQEEAQRATSDLNYTKLDGVPICITLMKENDEHNLHNNIENISLSIRNLHPDVNPIDLHDIFEAYGDVISCKIPTYRNTNNVVDNNLLCGYGFVCFRNQEDVERVMFAFDDAIIQGHPLEIKPISINIDTTYNEGLFEGCSSLSHISIQSALESIKDDEFKGCSSLTQITIPSSVTTIGRNAFYGCSSLTQITIPSSVISIKDSAFYGCSSLTQITFPSHVTTIGNKIFDGIKTLEIIGNITNISQNLFIGCATLTQISIPSSVTSIDNFAFYDCIALSQIIIPTSVTSIGYYAFSGCISLKQISIPNSVTSIGNGAFCGCSSLTEIEIPSSVNKINKLISENVDKDFCLEEIKFTDELRSIKYINDSTIYISNLPVNEEVYPPSCNVDEEFLRELFEDYHISSSSDAITINTTIRKDGTAYSFAYIEFDTQKEAQRATSDLNYTKLDGVPICITLMKENDEHNLHNNIENISLSIRNLHPDVGPIDLHDIFMKFGEVISCKIPTYRKTDDIEGNYLSCGYGFVCFRNQNSAKQARINLEGAKINDCPFEISPISINIGISCNEGLFEGCSSLSHISIQSTLESIEDNEFKGCSSLTQITIPSSVTMIGQNAFYGCSSLTQITIPSSVIMIGQNAFYGCSSLTHITIPASINIKYLKIPSATKVIII